jgi:hypothetical protein
MREGNTSLEHIDDDVSQYQGPHTLNSEQDLFEHIKN